MIVSYNFLNCSRQITEKHSTKKHAISIYTYAIYGDGRVGFQELYTTLENTYKHIKSWDVLYKKKYTKMLLFFYFMAIIFRVSVVQQSKQVK